MHKKNVTIIISTNRKASLSEKVAMYYGNICQQKKYTVEYLSLQHLPHDFAFSALYEHRGKNTAFNIYSDAIKKAEQFIFIIPEYNGSFPGILKTFIDGLSFPDTFQNKKAALVGISKGAQGATLALSHFTDILHYLGMNVLPQKIRLPNLKENDIKSITDNPSYVALVKMQMEQFLTY